MPLSNILWEFPRAFIGVFIEDLAITGSKIMMRVRCSELLGQHAAVELKIFVWDWRTGDLVWLVWPEWLHLLT